MTPKETPVTEALATALETTLHQLGGDQADALRATAQGDFDTAAQHIANADHMTKSAVTIATVLQEELDRTD